jgi:hypothetical protein
MRKMMFAVFLLCFVPTYAKTTIPEELLNAKTAVVLNEGAEVKDYEKLCKLLKEWGRFEFVETRGAADIIIKLSIQLKTRNVQLPSTSGGLGGFSPQQVIVSYLIIYDAKNDNQLWTDETPCLGSQEQVEEEIGCDKVHPNEHDGRSALIP